ncbi:MAG: hypothetical protein R3F65_32455 [bacterium]
MGGFLDRARFPVFNTNSVWLTRWRCGWRCMVICSTSPIINRKRRRDPGVAVRDGDGRGDRVLRARGGHRVGWSRFAPVKATRGFRGALDVFTTDASGAWCGRSARGRRRW